MAPHEIITTPRNIVVFRISPPIKICPKNVKMCQKVFGEFSNKLSAKIKLTAQIKRSEEVEHLNTLIHMEVREGIGI